MNNNNNDDDGYASSLLFTQWTYLDMHQCYNFTLHLSEGLDILPNRQRVATYSRHIVLFIRPSGVHLFSTHTDIFCILLERSTVAVTNSKSNKLEVCGRPRKVNLGLRMTLCSISSDGGVLH